MDFIDHQKQNKAHTLSTVLTSDQHSFVRLPSSFTVPESAVLWQAHLCMLSHHKRGAGMTQKDAVSLMFSTVAAQPWHMTHHIICSSSWACSTCLVRRCKISGTHFICQDSRNFLDNLSYLSVPFTKSNKSLHPQRTLRKSDINGKIEILLSTLQILFLWPPRVSTCARALNSSFVGSNSQASLKIPAIETEVPQGVQAYREISASSEYVTVAYLVHFGGYLLVQVSKSLLKTWPEALSAQYTNKQIKRLSLLG